jgi:hypothetical protein
MKKYIFTEEQIKKVINKTVSEQETEGMPTSDTHEFSGYRIEKREPNGINLQEQLLFIIDNLDGRHTESAVGREQMTEVLKETIRRFVNPNDTISFKEWNSVYYPITNDDYA